MPTDKKWSAFTVGTALDSGDLLAFVDISEPDATKNKIITKSNFGVTIAPTIPFSELDEISGAFTTAAAIYRTNLTADGLEETTVKVAEPAPNQFEFVSGTTKLAMSANLSVTGVSAIDQNVSVAASPDFAEVRSDSFASSTTTTDKLATYDSVNAKWSIGSSIFTNNTGNGFVGIGLGPQFFPVAPNVAFKPHVVVGNAVGNQSLAIMPVAGSIGRFEIYDDLPGGGGSAKWALTKSATNELDLDYWTGAAYVSRFNISTSGVVKIPNLNTANGIVQASATGVLSSSVTLPDGTLATTQSAGDNSTKLATTAYVDTAVGAENLWDRDTVGTPFLKPFNSGDEIGATGTRISKGWFTNVDATSVITATVNPSGTGPMSIGTTNHTGLTIGRSGAGTTFNAASMIYSLAGSLNATTSSGDFNWKVSTSGKVFRIWDGTLDNIFSAYEDGYIEVRPGQYIDTDASGTYAIGPTNMTTLSLGRTTQVVKFLGDIEVPGGDTFDTTASGSYTIGGVNMTTLNLGRSGQSVVFKSKIATLGTDLDISPIGGDVVVNCPAGFGVRFDSTSEDEFILRNSSADAGEFDIISEKSRSGGVITTGDRLMRMRARGHDGTGFIEGARMDFTSTGTIATNQVPTNFSMQLMNTSGTLAERFAVSSEGAFKINGIGSGAVQASSGVLSASTLTVGNGGTGLTSYTVGDLLYASGTTALSKLSDIAVGNALISGGVGVAPSWGKIGLTTHVSGVLPIANGGTNSSAALTNGKVMVSSAGAIVESTALTVSGNNLAILGDLTITGGDISATSAVGLTITTGAGASSNVIIKSAHESSLDVYSDSADPGEFDIAFYKTRSGGVITTGDRLGRIVAYGHDGTTNRQAGRMDIISEGTISTGIVPGKWQWYTTNSAGTQTLGMSLNSAQNLTIAGHVEIPSTDAFYLGDTTTDGSWRIIRSGNDLQFERRESSSWVSKGSFTA